MTDGSRLRVPQSTATTLDATTLQEGEVRHDITADELRIGDGSTLGGIKLARKSAVTALEALVAQLGATPISAAMAPPIQAATRAAGAFLLGVPWFDPSWAPYSADATGATDASSVFATVAAAAETAKRSILIQGQYLIGASSITGDNMAFVGFGGDEALYPYTDGPSQLRVTNTSNSPFKIGESVSMSGLTVIYPNQVEGPSAPIAYPPLFVNENNTTTVAGFKLDHFTCIGATTLCQFGSLDEFEKAGQLAFRGVRAFCTGTYIDLTHTPDTVHADHCSWGLHVYGDEVSHFGSAGAGGILTVMSITRSGTTATVTTAVAHGRSTGANVTITGANEADYNVINAEITVTGSDTFTYEVANSPSTPATGTIKANIFPLRAAHRDNAKWLRVWGDGTASSLSTKSVDGFAIVNNSWLGFDSIIYIAGENDASGEHGGFLQIVTLTGGFVDQTKHLLKVGPGGATYTFTATGFTGYQERAGDTTWFGYFIDIEDPAPGPSSSTFTEVNVSDLEMGYMRGGLATITGDYVERVSITGFSCPVCIHTSENGDRSFVVIDAPNADIILHVNRVTAANTATGSRTFCEITNARSVDVRGVFDNWDCVIENNSATAKVSFNGKTFNDGGDAIQGTYAGNVKVASESEIESMPTLSQPAGDNALINGAFDVWQRGTTFSPTTIVYTADRWKARRTSSAAGATFSRQAGFNGATYCARLSRDSADSGVQAVFLGQQILSEDCIKYQSSEFFVGLDARKGADFSADASLLVVTVFTGTGTDEVVNPATGFATGNVSQVKTLTLTTTGKRFVAGPFDIASNVTEIAVVFAWTPVGTAGAADHCEITRISAGNLATAQRYPFRHARAESDLCQKFYEKSYNQTVNPATATGNGAIATRCNGTAHVMQMRYARKQKAPTITLYNPDSGGSGTWRNYDASSDLTATASNVGESGCQIALTSSTDNHLVLGHFTADAEIGP